MTKFYIGTAGWSYLRWDKEFYPKGTKAADKLGFYASRFNAVELNNSFYHLPKPEQFAAWEKHVPASFQFAVKAPQYITHTKKLSGVESALHELLDVASGHQKIGPLFFQLPPRMKMDLDRLSGFLEGLPSGVACTIEFRDPSWHNKAVYRMLEQKNVAFCLYDTLEGASPKVITADFAYVRLLGRDQPKLKTFLRQWHGWLVANADRAYVFFHNHEDKSLAFGNALLFQEAMDKGAS